MRIIVTGGRDYDPQGQGRRNVGSVLSAIHAVKRIETIVHGRCWNPKDADTHTGADFWAFIWAKNHNVEHEPYPADWKAFGRAAGPLRNTKMAELGADLCIAFPGGRGTDDMTRKATTVGISVLDLRDRNSIKFSI